ncbi:hypothetical protein BDV96DRAFT_566412 [Lophiotrema nucula]|uniref:VWFA domain-containing protein n=1 Tax=Lophiotrema nucula TaxID=690887 RepID=A0A6A5ZMA6_9PLEO|nr:hypothetical protein BDV96DRAFT_566412 [Lophiotrema nucula]
MSATLTTILVPNGGPPKTSYLHISPNMASKPSSTNMFDKVKRKLTRRSSNPRTSSTTSAPKPSTTTSRSGNLSARPQSQTPFTTGSPATRRPDRAGMNAFTTPSNEPPPAYTPGPAQQSTGPASTTVASTDDDQYFFLRTFDTVFLIDDSGSMCGRSWRETREALETITPICTQRDADGIDIYFLNHPDSEFYQNVTSPGTVSEIFDTVRPGGGTPTGQRLNKLLRPYLARYQANPEGTKPINIIVITDGEPSDDVETPIIVAAKKLDKLEAPAWQVGIQFFQVGKEPGAREHLKQLDDGLAELAGDDELRDIVDTVPFTGADNEALTAAGIMKVVLGSVNRRLDRNSKELHRRN